MKCFNLIRLFVGQEWAFGNNWQSKLYLNRASQWMSGLLCYKDELNKQVCCLTAYILRDQSSYTRGVSNTLDKKLFHPVQAFIVNEKDRLLESSAFLPSWLDLSTIKLRKLEFVLPEKIRNIMLGIHWLRNIQKIFKFDSLFWAFVWLK